MVVLLAVCTLSVAGSICWLSTVVFWPAAHAGGETYSKLYALMMRARNAHNVDDVIILDNGASRTYLSIFGWLTNPMPCNGTVTSAMVSSLGLHILDLLVSYQPSCSAQIWHLIYYLSVTLRRVN